MNATEAVLYAALNVAGRVVYSHESRENVEMNAHYIKTPTRVVGLAAIAPPVAAGSVGKGKIDDLLVELSIAAVDVSRGGHSDIHRDAALELINAIDAWGAQQREAGRLEGKASNETLLRASVNEMDAMERERDEARQRAEKAEANYKIVCDKNDILRKYAEEHQAISDKWQDKAEDALARVKELEAQLSRRRAPLSPEAQRAIAAVRAGGQAIAAAPGGLIFLNDGTGPGEGELDCPACGGSGHAGDVVAGSAP